MSRRIDPQDLASGWCPGEGPEGLSTQRLAWGTGAEKGDEPVKITWKWLEDYMDLTGLTPEQVAEDLTNAGIPVERVERVVTRISGVRVGRVIAVEPHPKADRLRVCRVDAGEGEPTTIVCGAANVAAGQKVPVALPGAELPETLIERTVIRGVESAGMICSASEIGLDARMLGREQAEGILVLPQDAPVGASILEYLGLDDVVLELELTPNRTDCLSLYGVAHEVGALYGRSVRMPSAAGGKAPASEERDAARGASLPDKASAKALSVDLQTLHCEGYAAAVVDGLTVRPSPVWMQMRLLAVGVRPINNLVDVTNYVMFEWGQPLHAFDWEKVSGGQIQVREAEAGERLVTLDGQERELTPGSLVIADPEKALGLAGVMGGLNSEVTGDTRTVVLESALFDPLQVRRAAKALGIRSEAGVRFEKGIDPAVTVPALERAAALMAEFGGGTVQEGRMVAGPLLSRPPQETVIRLNEAEVSGLIGYSVERHELTGIFTRLGFRYEESGEDLDVHVPSRRPDVRIREDLIEEFARLSGYDRIPATLMRGSLTRGGLTRAQRERRSLRNYLMDIGFQEVWPYTFVNPNDAIRRLGVPEGHTLANMAPLLRPLSEERSALRSTLLLSLLEVAAYNVNRRNVDLRLFEIGVTFHPHELPVKSQPLETEQVAGLIMGRAEPSGPWASPRAADFYDLKGVADALLRRAGLFGEAVFHRSLAPYFHPGQSADIAVAGVKIGEFGRLRDSVLAAYGIPECLYFELDLPGLFSDGERTVRVRELPRFPASERDLAVVVPRETDAQGLLLAAREAGGGWLREAEVFDVYRGAPIPDDKKSVAMRLVFQSYDRTLTDDEVDAAAAAVASALASRFGAALRA